MNFITYRLTKNSEGVSVIIGEQSDITEIACHGCGATWLHGMRELEHICPYCGGGAFDFDTVQIAPPFCFVPLAEITEAVLAEQTQAAYGRDLRGIARALWNGSIDFDQAFGLFDATIRLGLTTAWHAGAKECGIEPSELTPEERQAMQDAIYDESGRVFGFLIYIEQNDKESGGKFGPILSRVGLWSNRYLDVMNRAKMRACGNQKLAWRLNYIRISKEHCVDCSRLAGKVKRASQWEASGWQPQGSMLACGGWRCACGFEVTDEPMSMGPLPRVH